MADSTGDPDADAVMGIGASSAPAVQASPTGDPDADAVLKISGTQETKREPSGDKYGLGRSAALAGRAIATGVAALPALAMDAGVGARNLVGDAYNKLAGKPATPDYEMPSSMFQKGLTDLGVPEPKTPIEKGASFVESALSGGAVGGAPSEAVEAGAAAPGVRNGIAAGYKVPPATTNPTMLNKGVETVAGKIATQQAMSAANQPITNQLAAQALGLNPHAPLTLGAIQAVRSEAAQDYAAIGKIPKIPLDDVFTGKIQNIVAQFNKTAEELPSLGSKDLDPVATELSTTPQLSGQAALGAVRSLRNKADMAFRAGDGGTGSAFKQMSNALEDAIDRGASSQGPEYQGVVDSFRSARQKMAISHSVEDAFNSATGNVVAPKLGKALNNGEHLSGPLKTIAEFSNSFKAPVTAEPNSSPVSHLDILGPLITGGIEAGSKGEVGPGTLAAALAYPAARMGAKALIKGPMQKLALPGAKKTVNPKFWLSGPAATASESTQE
jgi:hypothetical protein